MTLELYRHTVTAVRLGGHDEIVDGCVNVDAEGLESHLRSEDPRISDIQIITVQPGDAARIVCVKDVVQPRVKTSGTSPGAGVLRILDGMAVVTCGPIVGYQEGIIDMSGPGAAYTPFSQMPLVVLTINVRDGLGPHEHEEAVREAGLRAAQRIAEVCVDAEPDEIEKIARAPIPAGSDLPRIAYVYMVLSEGLLHDTYVFGRNAKEGLPIIVEPGAIYDNGVVSGNCVSACDKNTTYHHQNNPIVAALLEGHGLKWDFAGIVITNEPIRLSEKEQAAKSTVELVTGLKTDGAILSKEGFGNPDTDLMLLLKGLEQANIATVAITDEFAGSDGGSQSLADTTPEADAIVSVGNANQRIVLPAMAKTIGPLPDVARIAGGYPHTLHDDGTLEVELQAIIGATNQLGFGRLSCREV